MNHRESHRDNYPDGVTPPVAPVEAVGGSFRGQETASHDKDEAFGWVLAANIAAVMDEVMRTDLWDLGDTAPTAAAMPNVVKVGHSMPISSDTAMDYGLIPDTREHKPIPRRVRWGWRVQGRVYRLRVRVASWIAGFDVEASA